MGKLLNPGNLLLSVNVKTKKVAVIVVKEKTNFNLFCDCETQMVALKLYVLSFFLGIIFWFPFRLNVAKIKANKF